MMTLRIRVLFIILLLVVLSILISFVRQRKLELKYVLLWIGSDILLILIMLFPKVLISFSRLLGIYNPMNAVIFVGFLFLMLIIFSLTVALSHATDQIRRLTQILAIREIEEQDEERESAQKKAPVGIKAEQAQE